MLNWFSVYIVLMIAEDGNIYGGYYDTYLCKIANSPLEAIEAIIFNYEFIDIALRSF